MPATFNLDEIIATAREKGVFKCIVDDPKTTFTAEESQKLACFFDENPKLTELSLNVQTNIPLLKGKILSYLVKDNSELEVLHFEGECYCKLITFQFNATSFTKLKKLTITGVEFQNNSLFEYLALNKNLTHVKLSLAVFGKNAKVFNLKDSPKEYNTLLDIFKENINLIELEMYLYSNEYQYGIFATRIVDEIRNVLDSTTALTKVKLLCQPKERQQFDNYFSATGVTVLTRNAIYKITIDSIIKLFNEHSKELLCAFMKNLIELIDQKTKQHHPCLERILASMLQDDGQLNQILRLLAHSCSSSVRECLLMIADKLPQYLAAAHFLLGEIIMQEKSDDPDNNTCLPQALAFFIPAMTAGTVQTKDKATRLFTQYCNERVYGSMRNKTIEEIFVENHAKFLLCLQQMIPYMQTKLHKPYLTEIKLNNFRSVMNALSNNMGRKILFDLITAQSTVQNEKEIKRLRWQVRVLSAQVHAKHHPVFKTKHSAAGSQLQSAKKMKSVEDSTVQIPKM